MPRLYLRSLTCTARFLRMPGGEEALHAAVSMLLILSAAMLYFCALTLESVARICHAILGLIE